MDQDIIKKLSEPFPEEAIQRTKGTDTRKGYDTTGIGYQWCVDRFNETCGDKWGFSWEVIRESQGSYKSGQPYHDVTVRVSIWVGEENRVAGLRSCVGGHISATYADALKGAITNGFKKTASFWGCGRDAFAGTIDTDNQPLPDSHENRSQTRPEPRSEVREESPGYTVEEALDRIMTAQSVKNLWAIQTQIKSFKSFTTYTQDDKDRLSNAFTERLSFLKEREANSI